MFSRWGLKTQRPPWIRHWVLVPVTRKWTFVFRNSRHWRRHRARARTRVSWNSGCTYAKRKLWGCKNRWPFAASFNWRRNRRRWRERIATTATGNNRQKNCHVRIMKAILTFNTLTFLQNSFVTLVSLASLNSTGCKNLQLIIFSVLHFLNNPPFIEKSWN